MGDVIPFVLPEKKPTQQILCCELNCNKLAVAELLYADAASLTDSNGDCVILKVFCEEHLPDHSELFR